MGFAAVARVTEDRWIACSVRDDIAFGLEPGGELKVETTICHEIRQKLEPVIINNVAEDSTYSGHATPRLYGFQSYISMPIMLADGTFFGTLCAIDPRPARLNTPEIIGMFKLFAELIAFHLDAHDRLALAEESLLDERASSELREQFIAVLGHDLRNPLAAIESGARMLLKREPDAKARTIIELVQGSVSRMSGLIDNVLDFARGRLGGGFALDQLREEALQPVLDQVVSELRAAFPARAIDTHFELTETVYCDRGRISQLVSNLLGNALSYGAPERPISVTSVTSDGLLEISVANAGRPISPAAMERLFQPFFRGEDRQNRQGLGLGLHIASQIASAHGGTLSVTSNASETRFTFKMPLDGLK